MSIRRRLATLAAVPLLLGLLAPVAGVSAASTITVKPGQSIQAAIDRAPAGATIVVSGGTYKGNLEIARSVHLVGPGAVVMPGPRPTPNICLTPGFFDGVVGVCIHGTVKADGSGLDASVSDVSIDGLTVRSFTGPGIVALGVDGLRLVRIVTAHNGEMGMFINTVSGLSLLYASSYDNHGDGIFLENLPKSGSSSDTVVVGNASYDNLGSGIMVINSLGGRIALNALSGDCAGILVIAEGEGGFPPTSGDVAIELNQVTANSRMCPADGSGAPPYGGIGIGLIGAQNTAVELNDVRDNVAQTGSAIQGGGIVLLDGTPMKAAAPTGDTIRLNRLSGNAPDDIYGDGTGTGNTVSGNACTKSNLTGAC